MVNPNPELITNEMWYLWENRPNLQWKLSGFYADKKGYHNTVIRNKEKWPGNYSIRVPLDLKHGNQNKSRAIDLTMSNEEMVKWTARMSYSALDPKDSRLDAVREFYGTLDNKTVYGLIKDSATGSWRKSSADLTHLWHGHTSIFAAFVNDPNMLRPLLSVWSGETYEEWSTEVPFPKRGDVSEEVKYWQTLHNYVRESVTPPSPELGIDGDYGDATVAAFTDFAKKKGAQPTYNAAKITGWLAFKYELAKTVLVAAKAVPQVPPVNSDVIKAAVDAWLLANIPHKLKITGDLDGFVELSD